MKTKIAALLLMLATAAPAVAAEIGHYAGGLANMRDYFVPEPGVYGALYNYYYQTGRVNDLNGSERDTVTIDGPGPGLTLDIDPDVDLYALAPAVIWVSPWRLLGARYAALVLPSFANASIGASLSTQSGRGVNHDDSQFGIGDLYVQPLWLGWPLEHWDLSVAWGFYAPTGKYDTEPVSFPIVGDRRVEAADNIGYGFWTNQFQGAVAWYPWVNKATAVTVVLTYEVHSEKEDFDITAGNDLTLNWGISQFLPLTKDQKWLVELGPAGYDTWQVTSDSGSDAKNGVLDQVHGVGFQAGITSVGWLGSLNFHYFYEVESQDRFQGHVFGLNIAKSLTAGWGEPIAE